MVQPVGGWPAKRGRGRARSGFTLIELLVVIAIVALLLTILTPSLQRAREAARRSVCAGQVRDFTTAVHVYAVEENGFIPARNGAVHQIWGGRYYDATLLAGVICLFERGHLADRRMMVCPSRANPVRGIGTAASLNNRFWESTSGPFWYEGNSAYSYPGGSSALKDLDEITAWAYYVRLEQHDREQALFVDAVCWPEDFTGNYSFPWLQQTNHWRDGVPEGGNASFADGHAEWLAFGPEPWVRPDTVCQARFPDGSHVLDWYNSRHHYRPSHKYYFATGDFSQPRRGVCYQVPWSP